MIYILGAPRCLFMPRQSKLLARIEWFISSGTALRKSGPIAT